MSHQPCKILSLITPNCFAVQNQQSKKVIVGKLTENYLIKTNPSTSDLQLYQKQLQYVGKDAIYSTKNQVYSLQVDGKNILEQGSEEQKVDLKLIGMTDENHQAVVDEFIKKMRFKSIEAILVSIEGNQLNFLYNWDTLINVIPASIYIDDFTTLDGSFLRMMQHNWLSKTFQLTFKGIQTLSVPGKEKYNHIRILTCDIILKGQSNPELSNEFYCSLVSQGFAYVTDYGKTQLPQNSFQLLFQSQEEAKKDHLGLWKNGELDRRILNLVSSQLIGKVVEVVEANQYKIQTSEELLNVKLDRIFIEGYEAKEYTRKLLIGKMVQVLQIGDNIPSYSIQLIDTQKNVEEELIANGWAIVKESHPHLSKFKLQQFQQLNQQAKQKKLGQYGQEMGWRLEDQTDRKLGKSVNETVWESIKQEQQKRKERAEQGFRQSTEVVIEAIVDKVLDGNQFHMILQEHHSIVNFQIEGIVKFNDFVQSFPSIVKYDQERKQFLYDSLMQRSVYITCDTFNVQENVFRGRLYQKKSDKNSDITISLLSKGFTFLSNNKDYYNLYAEAQQNSQKHKVGIWSEPYAEFLLDFTLTQKKYKPKTIKESNIKKQQQTELERVIITEIVDCNEFYIRTAQNEQFTEIEQKVQKTQLTPLAKPVKKGTLCLAKFSVDDQLYRAQVVQVLHKGGFLVKFIDYGNIDQVEYEDMGVLPGELATIPRQARVCSMAYLRFPYPAHPFAEEAAQQFRELVWDQELLCRVAYVDHAGVKQFLMMYFADQIEEDANSLNAALLSMGVARVEDRVLENPLKKLTHFQVEAQNEGKGFWIHDDQLDDSKPLDDDLTYQQI